MFSLGSSWRGAGLPFGERHSSPSPFYANENFCSNMEEVLPAKHIVHNTY